MERLHDVEGCPHPIYSEATLLYAAPHFNTPPYAVFQDRWPGTWAATLVSEGPPSVATDGAQQS